MKDDCYVYKRKMMKRTSNVYGDGSLFLFLPGLSLNTLLDHFDIWRGVTFEELVDGLGPFG